MLDKFYISDSHDPNKWKVSDLGIYSVFQESPREWDKESHSGVNHNGMSVSLGPGSMLGTEWHEACIVLC